MEIMFASDIYGSACYCRKTLGIYSESRAGRLVILGDLLYRGPRNDLPREYAPKGVITMPDPLKNQTYAIRGSRDTEVDQMALESPILADHNLLVLKGGVLYAIHGHVCSQDHLPSLRGGDVLIHGRTCIPKAKTIGAEGGRHITVLDPGSVSIPKGSNPNTYTVLENGIFSIRTLEDEVVKELEL